MGRFKKLVDDLQNNEPETIALLKNISEAVDKENSSNFSDNIFKKVDFTVKEDLICGYTVLYQYKKVRAKIKSDTDEDNFQSFMQMRIIYIIQPLNQHLVKDKQIHNMIYDKLVDIISNL